MSTPFSPTSPAPKITMATWTSRSPARAVGITALQMDIKIQGITPQIMREAMQQAKRGRLFILDKMNAVLSEARTKVSEYAPRFYTLQIPTDKIRDLIGPGGKVIRGIVEATGVKIDVDDSGKVLVSAIRRCCADVYL